MLPKVVTKEVFNDFVAKLIERGRVVGPKLKEESKGKEFFEFGLVESVDELRLDYPMPLLAILFFLLIRFYPLFFSVHPCSILN